MGLLVNKNIFQPDLPLARSEKEKMFRESQDCWSSVKTATKKDKKSKHDHYFRTATDIVFVL